MADVQRVGGVDNKEGSARCATSPRSPSKRARDEAPGRRPGQFPLSGLAGPGGARTPRRVRQARPRARWCWSARRRAPRRAPPSPRPSARPRAPRSQTSAGLPCQWCGTALFAESTWFWCKGEAPMHGGARGWRLRGALRAVGGGARCCRLGSLAAGRAACVCVCVCVCVCEREREREGEGVLAAACWPKLADRLRTGTRSLLWTYPGIRGQRTRPILCLLPPCWCSSGNRQQQQQKPKKRAEKGLFNAPNVQGFG
jgi:hypothetical protein